MVGIPQFLSLSGSLSLSLSLWISLFCMSLLLCVPLILWFGRDGEWVFLIWFKTFFSFYFCHFWKCCKQEHQRRQANVFKAGMDCVLTFFDIVVGVNYDAILLLSPWIHESLENKMLIRNAKSIELVKKLWSSLRLSRSSWNLRTLASDIFQILEFSDFFGDEELKNLFFKVVKSFVVVPWLGSNEG